MIGRLLVAALAVCVAWQEQVPRPTFRTSVDAVTVDVSVRDRARPVIDLTAADFRVLDNDVPQEVLDVSYGKLPIDVTVALDVSLSVTGRLLRDLRDATLNLMKDLGPDDRLRLITFNARISRTVDFTRDTQAVGQAIQEAVAGGGTSIYDAVSTALVSDIPDRRQLLVLLTDGADSTSITEPRVLFEVAQRSNVAVSTVMPMLTVITQGPVLSSGLSGTRVFRTSALRANPLFLRLAAETGGTLIAGLGGANLQSTFRSVLERFRSSYVLHYVPKGVTPGGFHTITVTVPGRERLTINARRGYSLQ